MRKITDQEFHLTQLAFLEKLKSIRRADSNMLTTRSLRSGIKDGDRHEHEDLPILLAGRGGGTITGGRHIQAPKGTPLNNLFCSMLDRVGTPVERFGDSTGRFEAIA